MQRRELFAGLGGAVAGLATGESPRGLVLRAGPMRRARSRPPVWMPRAPATSPGILTAPAPSLAIPLA
jgi:hypothetical protein